MLNFAENIRRSLRSAAGLAIWALVTAAGMCLAGPCACLAGGAQDAVTVDGIRLVAQPADDGLAAACVFVGVGTSHEGPAERGITRLLNDALLSAERDGGAGSPAGEIERLGGTVEVETEAEYSVFRLAVPVEGLARALAVLAGALSEPRITEECLVEQRRRLSLRAEMASDLPVEQCYRLLVEKTGPGGTGASGRLTAGDVSSWHAAYYSRDNVLVSVCAGIEQDELHAALRGGFRRMAGSSAGARRAVAPQNPAGGTSFDCTTASAGSAAVIGFAAPPPGSPDYPAVKLAEAVVAVGMGSKFFRSLRVEDKLAYSFGSVLTPTGTGSRLAFFVNAGPARIDDAVKGMLDSVDALKRGELTEAELERARGKVRGEVSLLSEGPAGKAWRRGLDELLGLGRGYWDGLAAGMDSIGPGEVAGAARKYMDKYTLVVARPGSGG